MCGRTACTLCKDDLQKACTYKNEKTGKYELPKWVNNPKTKEVYTPSYNVAPTDVTPVIIPGANSNNESKRMLQPMMWKMIPYWHKLNPKDHGYTTHNCRYEGLLMSRLYSRPLDKGYRCVVVCDGFYEWHTKGVGEKHPYFIHMPQEDGVRVDDPSTWTNDWDEINGWKGPKLVHMAGLYDVWTSPQGEEIYSYAIITTDTDDSLFWLHDRMPAIIEGQEIDDWLDIDRVSGKEAYRMLYPVKKPPRSLKWHPVAKSVNNSRFKDPSCNKPITLLNPKKPSGPHELTLLGWLKKITAIPNQGSLGDSSSCKMPLKKEEDNSAKKEPDDCVAPKKIKAEEKSPTKKEEEERN